MKFNIRNFQDADAKSVNRIAIDAFSQYKLHFSDWPAIMKTVGNMALLANNAELIVATVNEDIAGAVCYVAPGKEKNFFPIEWPIIRMLVVNPAYRNIGIGKALTEACVQKAILDNCSLIGLHTSHIMETALRMYLRMGFKLEREAPAIYGVAYTIYIKELL